MAIFANAVFSFMTEKYKKTAAVAQSADCSANYCISTDIFLRIGRKISDVLMENPVKYWVFIVLTRTKLHLRHLSPYIQRG
jgi:hypothetical protein